MSEKSIIKIQQTTVESLGTSVQVRLQVVYTTTTTPESVELSVVLPDTDRSLSEMQQEALDPPGTRAVGGRKPGDKGSLGTA
jgi:hypothetical protein